MLPILPLKAVLVPGVTLTVQLEEGRYQSLIERCMENKGELAVVFCSDYSNELTSMHKMGCKALIESYEVMDSNLIEVKLKGLHRFAFSETMSKNEIHYASGVQYIDNIIDIEDNDPLLGSVFDLYQNYMSKLVNFDVDMMPETCLTELKSTDSFKLLDNMSITAEKRQQGLEMLSTRGRLEFILTCLRLELDMLSFVTSKEALNTASVAVLN